MPLALHGGQYKRKGVGLFLGPSAYSWFGLSRWRRILRGGDGKGQQCQTGHFDTHQRETPPKLGSGEANR